MTARFQRPLAKTIAGVVVMTAFACSESPTAPTSPSVADAFLSAPLAFSSVSSSFAASGDAGVPWVPGGQGGRHHDGPGFGGLMGGGLDDAFLGGIGFGPGHGGGPFGESGLIGTCTFSATTGRISCAPVTLNGITIVRSAAYADAAGHAQQAFDSLTNTANTRVDVSGTVTFGGGMGHGFRLGLGQLNDSIISATTTVHNGSDRTVTGLAAASTQRTINGTSFGNEATTGTAASGAFSITRVVGDTTTGLVVPVRAAGTPPYPTAGAVVRSMRATVTLPGASTSTTTVRREVVTYDGSPTAKLVITQDGTTRTCSLPLPHGRPSCQ